jgi:hypothetical protein
MITEEQKKHIDSLKWFMYGGRAAGKTYLVCYVAILHSIQIKDWTTVIDHFPYVTNNLPNMLQVVLENEFDCSKYELVFRSKKYSCYTEFKIIEKRK